MGDFAEPFTGKFSSTFYALKAKYPNAQFIFKHGAFLPYLEDKYPAYRAAVECLAKQDKFWTNWDVLAASFVSLDLAKFQGIDRAAYDACLTSPEVISYIPGSNSAPGVLGIVGVPAFIISKSEPGNYSAVIQGLAPLHIFDQAIAEVQSQNLSVGVVLPTPYQPGYSDLVKSVNFQDRFQHDETPKVWGNPNPVVNVYIYGDLAEKFTSQWFNFTYPAIKTNFGSQVRFTFHHTLFFPWIANKSQTARSQSECVARQNQFELNIFPIMRELAVTGVNNEQYQACVVSSEVANFVKKSDQLATDLAITGSPTFFIQTSGSTQALRIDGAASYSNFEQAILAQGAIRSEVTTVPNLEPTVVVDNPNENLQEQITTLKEELEETKQQQSFLARELATLRELLNSIFQKLLGR